MLELAKDVIHGVAAPTGEFAKLVAANTANVAKKVGGATVATARWIGPKKALIGLAAIGAIFGSTMLVRYLRARSAADDADADDGIAVEDVHGKPLAGPGHKLSRAKRKAMRAVAH
jgi:hypothetical protein